MERNVLVSVLVAIIASYGMAFRPNRSQQAMVSSSSMTMKWDGSRPPCPRVPWLDQRMDATWGRGKFRTEVWEGDFNPVNNWWEMFHPSDEEIEAADAGYNFKDPAAYFKEKGIDSEKAMEAGIKFQNEEFEKYLKVGRRPLLLMILFSPFTHPSLTYTYTCPLHIPCCW